MKAPLPPACPLCRSERGLWMRTPSGLTRCICARGRILAAGKVRRVMGRPGNAAVRTLPERAHFATAPPVHFDGKLAATGEQ